MNLRIHQVTWNVASTEPLKDDFYKYLFSIDENFNYEFGKFPDIFVISLQEQSSGILSFIENQWQTKFKDFFKVLKSFKNEYYLKLKLNSIFSLNQYIFIKMKHVLKVKNIETLFYPILGGITGKGTILYKFNFLNHNISFFTAHYPAHDYKNNERIDYYKAVISKAFKNFNTNKNSFSFYAGDLNFRLIDQNINELIKNLYENPNEKYLENLIYKDQLNIARKSKLAFHHYKEHKINFIPTYKFVKNTKKYNTERTPSWCDRILYHSYNESNIEIIDYKSINKYKQSDHIPVIAIFDLKLEQLRLKRSFDCVKIVSDDKATIDQEFEVWLKNSSFISKKSEKEVIKEKDNKNEENKKNESENIKDVASICELGSKVENISEVDNKTEDENLTNTRTNWDWIGLFKEGFNDFDDYEAYVYVDNIPLKESPPRHVSSKATKLDKSEEIYNFDELEKAIEIHENEVFTDNSSHDSIEDEDIFTTDDYLCKSKWSKIVFSSYTFSEPGKYLLVYFNQDRSIKYISDSFEVTVE